MQGDYTLVRADARATGLDATRLDGALVVDKPAGLTSHDVVNRLRRILGIKKIGHLGTLDPMATGVLPLLIGRATRLAQFFSRNDKIYEAVIRFGFATDTFDAEGEPAGPPCTAEIEPDRIEILLDSFRGRFSQTPPPVSAKKVGGVPAYKLTRQNIAVELAPVDVEVFALDVLSIQGSDLHVRVHCSSGTYVRSIAHHLGQMAGCGAHLARLRRTLSGDFALDQARTIEQLQALAEAQRLEEAIVPPATLLPGFSSQYVDEITVGRIRQGRDFSVSPFRPNRESKFVKALDPAGDLVAIGELVLPNLCHPNVVL
jgi:tRNA pseudouridine55 synthase